MDRHEKIDYVEFAASDMDATKTFFTQVFGWSFTDYGPEYSDSPDGGIMTGFYKGDLKSTQENGGALVTFYSNNLEATLAEVTEAGGSVVKPIFDFPGGRRFQFTEPGGNEFAVWSDIALRNSRKNAFSASTARGRKAP
ncbi:MAG: VOC family protein [Pontiella sp.]